MLESSNGDLQGNFSNNGGDYPKRAPKKRSMEYIKDPEALIYKGIMIFT